MNHFMNGYRDAAQRIPLGECFFRAGLGNARDQYIEGWNSYWADQITLAQTMQHDYNKGW